LETFVHRTVGDDEQCGVAPARLVRGPRPVRDREDVVLRPLERLLADRRAALALDDQTDGVVRCPLLATFGATGESNRVAVERGHDAAAREWVDVAHGPRPVGTG